jgi:alpha-N-arabinofuranosidase
MLDVRCKIYPDQMLSSVNPMLFGNFIEFTHDCINQGMWAQLLINRGFENADTNGDGISEPWFKTGINDSGVYEMDPKNAFNSASSQKIQLIHHFGGFKGVAQRGLRLTSGARYEGYFWARARGITKATLRLNGSAGEVLWQMEIPLSSAGEWVRYPFSATVQENCLDAEFELSIAEEGEIWLDQMSLMPADAVGGIWRGVFDAANALESAIMRFPGGCFADCYHWQDGVGERDYRPTKPNPHWGGNEENNFGTDEFIQFCRSTRCEPLICVNFGSATAEEAAQWVEYCNGPATREFGALRAQNGHPEPYGVKYWGIGNETWAPWEVGNLPAEGYSEKYLAFCEAMRKADPSIRIMACGGDGNNVSQEWNRIVLQRAGNQADYLDLHFYAPQIYDQPYSAEEIYYATVLAPEKYERILLEAGEIIEELGLSTKLAVAEYNTMYYNDSNREHTLEAAIFNAGLLNVLLRLSGLVHIGNFSDLVNGWQGGCIRCKGGQVFCTPSYHVLKMYSCAGLATVLRSETDSPTAAVGKVGHVEAHSAPLVDCTACLDRQGDIRVFAVNRHISESARVQLDLPMGFAIRSITEITSEHPWDLNRMGFEPIFERDTQPEGPDVFVAKPHSICMIMLAREVIE